MALFALLNEDNEVLRIALIAEEKLVDIPRPVPSEVIDNRTFLKDVPGTWVETSPTKAFRGNTANVGDVYDDELDVFYQKQPYPSWTLNNDFKWEAPVAMPLEDKDYYWSESTQEWVEE